MFLSLLSTHIQKIKFKINAVKWYWRLKHIQFRWPRGFLRLLGHVCSKIIESSYSFYTYLFTLNKLKSDVNQHHLTPFPDRNNDTIFIKNPKTLRLGYFDHFLSLLPKFFFFPVKSNLVIYATLPKWTLNNVTSFVKN